MATTYLYCSWVIDGTLARCARLLFAKDLAFIASQGIRAIVRLATKEELALERDEVTAAGLDDCHEPVRVLIAPAWEQIDRIMHFIDHCVAHGKSVAISCGAGYGRTGTILACYFVQQGWSAAEAIAAVKRRGRSPYETDEQLHAIHADERRCQEA